MVQDVDGVVIDECFSEIIFTDECHDVGAAARAAALKEDDHARVAYDLRR